MVQLCVTLFSHSVIEVPLPLSSEAAPAIAREGLAAAETGMEEQHLPAQWG